MIARDIVDLGRPRRLHLVGIGGTGMAPFARLLAAAGHTLSGADQREGEAVARLREAGIPVLTGREADLLPAGIDALIHTAAVSPSAAPLRAARDADLPVLKYARAVGLYARDKRTLAVAGTHGKTTTTALLAHVLRSAGADPSYLVGGVAAQLPEPGLGHSDLLVVEACEYDRSFLHLDPEIAVITNVEADHLDYYGDILEIQCAFGAFAARVSRLLVVHESLAPVIRRATGLRAAVRTYGPSPEADVRVEPGDRRPGQRSFRVDGTEYPIGLAGQHNVLNAAAVLIVAAELGLELGVVAEGLRSFGGVGRRLQVVGQWHGVSVVDDYAHHPTEVAATLRALRDEFAPRRLWCVFQPHQYSRLRRFLDDFAQALADADRVVVPEIFAARDADEDRRAVSAGDLVAAVRTHGGDAVHIPDFGTIVDFVRTQARPGDVVVTMGAGDVGDVADRLATAL